MFLIQKYTQYKAAQAEQQKRKVTEKELVQLNHKIDKLLTKLDEHEPEIATNQDEECVVCVNAKATMQTYPCGHRVVCRKCFVKTIQMAVAQRLLPLRCVICRAKILRLKHINGDSSSTASTPSSASSSGSSTSAATCALRQTISHWYRVPQSDSLYSMQSNASGASRISATSVGTVSSFKTCASTLSSFCKSKMGYELLKSPSSPSPPSFRKFFSRKSSTNPAAAGHNSSLLPGSSSQSPSPVNSSKIATISNSMTLPLRTRSSSSSTSSSKSTIQKSPSARSTLPKKDHRIVPVQPPKPLPLGLSPCKKASPSSPASAAAGSGGTGHSPSAAPLKGKLKLVQEFQREFHTERIAAAANCKPRKSYPHQYLHGHRLCNGQPRLRCFRQLQQAQHPNECHCKPKSAGGGSISKDPSLNSITSCLAAIPSSSTSTTVAGNSGGYRKGTTVPRNATTAPGPTGTVVVAGEGSSNGTGTSPNIVSTPIINRMPPPSSQSCPSFKQFGGNGGSSRFSQCHNHYHHHRCNGCGTDRLKKLEPLMEVK